jgi:formate-dependent nitrite reductase cytochrome c552 subunit
MADSVDCEGCHDLTRPTTVEAIDATCMDCHEDEEERFDGMLASWKAEVVRLLTQAEEAVDEDSRWILDALREAGPLHNIEATRVIIGAFSSDSEPPDEPTSQ